MLDIVVSNRFKKDLKLAMKRGYNMALLETVVECLASGQLLEKRYQDHLLTGEYGGFRECHITPDWLLVYQVRDTELVLFLSSLALV